MLCPGRKSTLKELLLRSEGSGPGGSAPHQPHPCPTRRPFCIESSCVHLPFRSFTLSIDVQMASLPMFYSFLLKKGRCFYLKITSFLILLLRYHIFGQCLLLTKKQHWRCGWKGSTGGSVSRAGAGEEEEDMPSGLWCPS